MKRRFLIMLEVEHENPHALPIEAVIAAALAHSTAAEAIAEATGCECSMRVATPEEIDA